MKIKSFSFDLILLALRLTLLAALFTGGWLVYRKLPETTSHVGAQTSEGTTVQLILLRDPEVSVPALDVPVDLYPIDIVAVRHEFFAERRAGERFDDFLKQRMKGRKPVSARLDKKGQAMLQLAPGHWWIHAVLAGDEDLEWRLPVTVAGRKQTVELTPQNAYTRTKNF